MSARIVVVGSSSRGNAYAIETDKETLLIEAGLPLTSVRKQTDLSKVCGVLVSHHHGDHAKHVGEYAVRFPISAPQGVLKKCTTAIKKVPIYEGKTLKMGGFSYTPFLVPHSDADGKPCPNAGYLIYHKEIGSLLFVTDTYTLPYRFCNVEHFVIEANYSDDILNDAVRTGKTSKSQADRIRLSHFAWQHTTDSIRQCGTDSLRDITLIHLSARHSDPRLFKDKMEGEFGVPVHIARAGEKIVLASEEPMLTENGNENDECGEV